MDETLPSSSSDQFLLFPQLPAELRLRIWELALPPPRVVKIFECHCRPHLMTHGSYDLGTCDEPPVHLQINVEARAFALITYRLAFSCSALNYRPTYFNFSKDILHFSTDALWTCGMGKGQDHPELLDEFKQVTNLQLADGLYHWSGDKHSIQDLFDIFPAIEELVLGCVMGCATERLIAARSYYIDDPSHKVFTKYWSSYTANVELVNVTKVDDSTRYRFLTILKLKSTRARSVGKL